MSDGFYLKTEIHKNIKNEDVIHKDVLFFKHEKSSFDGKATKEHVKNFNLQYQAFLASHPGFTLPDSFSDVEIGKPL